MCYMWNNHNNKRRRVFEKKKIHVRNVEARLKEDKIYLTVHVFGFRIGRTRRTFENFIEDFNSCYACSLTGIHVLPFRSGVINDRVRLNGGIGRVIKYGRTLLYGITFQNGEAAVLTDVRL